MCIKVSKNKFFHNTCLFSFHYLKEQKGIALVVTLLALVLITAMVVEFSYGVYTGTNNLYNWRDSQRLSIMAKSGINVSAKFLTSLPMRAVISGLDRVSRRESL